MLSLKEQERVSDSARLFTAGTHIIQNNNMKTLQYIGSVLTCLGVNKIIVENIHSNVD